MKTPNKNNELSRIEKRAIEASAIAPFFQAVAEKIGKESALAILQEVNEHEAFQRGEAIREQIGSTGMPELVEDVATWSVGGKMDIEVLEQTTDTYRFNVTRCPYYEKYRELGMEELGVALSCCRDEPFARGFHPELKLVRTQTIMEGGDFCDFCYTLRSASE